MYVNWQSSEKGGLLLVFTEQVKEQGYFSSTWKLNRSGSVIAALTQSGLAEEKIIGHLKEQGYKIGNGQEAKIRKFLNEIKQKELDAKLKGCRERLPGLLPPSTGILAGSRLFENPKLMAHREYKGLAHEKWSKNLGKYSSYGQFRYPIKVNFDVTRNCNLACPYCYLPSENNASDLPLEKIKLILDRLSESNIQLVNLFGGEPLARKDIFEIIEYCSAKGMAVALNTNGLLLDNDRIERLKKLGAAYLHVSLDADSQKVFSEMRGTDKFGILVENIRAAVRAGLQVQLNCTLTKVNITRLAQIYWLARSTGASTFSVGPFHSLGEGLKNKEKFAVNGVIFYLWVNFFGLIFRSGKTAYYIKERCDANSYIHIDHAGNCHYCSQMPRQMPLGNVLEQNLLEIWHSDAYKKLFTKEYLGEPCNSCIFADFHCNSWRCRAEPAAERNDIYAGNTRCIRGKISKTIKMIGFGRSRSSKS